MAVDSGPGPPRRTAELLLFTWTAGTLDGLSYLAGRVFTANMTGNTVLLGLYAVRQQLGAFLAGAVAAAALSPAGASMRQTDRSLVWAARIEIPLLAAFAALWVGNKAAGAHALGFPSIVLAGIALGILSVAVRRLRIQGVVTTFITSTITAAAAGLVSAVQRRRRTGAWPRHMGRVADLAALFGIYLGAAASAGYLSLHHPVLAAILPFPSLVAVMIGRR